MLSFSSKLHLNHRLVLNTIKQTVAQNYTVTTAGLSAIRQHDDILGAVYEETRELRKNVDRVQLSHLKNSSFVVDQLPAKLDTLTNASSQQHDEIIHLLREIQQQTHSQKSLDQNTTKLSRKKYSEVVDDLPDDLQHLAEASCMPEEIDTTQAPIESKPRTTTESGLSDYIDRLCLLSFSKRGTVASEEAEAIIEDLESLLIEVMRTNQIAKDFYQQGTKRKATDVTNGICSPERAIKRARRALANSGSFEIGQVAPRRASAQRTGLKISYQGSRSYDVQQGALAISYAARSSSNVQSPEGCVETLDGTLSLLMPHQPHCIKLNVWFSQKRRGRQFDILPSTISFQSVRPDQSIVFKIAASGCVEKLVELFEAGMASLSDCDSEGRSLLNVRLYTPHTSPFGTIKLKGNSMPLIN
jgi:cell division septum initiation protein DivIVA